MTWENSSPFMCHCRRVRSAAGQPCNAHACRTRWQRLVEIFVCSRSCSPCFSRPPFLGTTPGSRPHFQASRHHQKPQTVLYRTPVTMVRIPGQPPRAAPRKRQPLDNMLDSVESWITERNGFVVRRRAVSTPEAPTTHHAPARRSSSSVTTPISTALVLQILGMSNASY